MDQYRTEEEQVEALRRWWDENGRSTIVAIVIAVSLSFAYQTWKGNAERQRENASDLYQAMLQSMVGAQGDAAMEGQGVAMAEQLKSEYGGSTYAQFAALHLARLAVDKGELAEAESQLRWVLGKADKGSDTGQLAQLRLARVLAASGDSDQALAILDSAGQGSYQASNPGQVNLQTLQQKLQSLNPVPARELVPAAAEPAGDPAVSETTPQDQEG